MSDSKKLSIIDLMEIKKHLDRGAVKVKVLDIEEDDAGGATINVEVDEEFMNWFKKREGLKRWSNKRFHKFFTENLQNYLRHGPETKK